MKRKELKVNAVYIIIYIVLIICLIFIHFYLLKAFTFLTSIPPAIFRPFINYTFSWNQPAMWPLLLIYEFINFHPFHIIYIVFLCTVFFVLVIILLLWLIGLMIKKILFFNPFANMSPWQELNEMGFFTWFFDRTFLEKNKDVFNFILDIFRTVITSEEAEAAQRRFEESFKNKEPEATIATPKHKEYIDYDLSKNYITERKDDMFYTESFKSIKHRESANYYRNMTILRPDTVGEFKMPNIDIEEMLNLNKSYLFI